MEKDGVTRLFAKNVNLHLWQVFPNPNEEERYIPYPKSETILDRVDYHVNRIIERKDNPDGSLGKIIKDCCIVTNKRNGESFDINIDKGTTHEESYPKIVHELENKTGKKGITITVSLQEK